MSKEKTVALIAVWLSAESAMGLVGFATRSAEATELVAFLGFGCALLATLVITASGGRSPRNEYERSPSRPMWSSRGYPPANEGKETKNGE